MIARQLCSHASFAALDRLECIVDVTPDAGRRTVDPVGSRPVATPVDNAVDGSFLEEEASRWRIEESMRTRTMAVSR